MRKTRLFSILALLLVAATGAWAQGYTVTLKDGTEDAANWTITPKEGLSEGDQVTIQYNGRLKVKGVKATSDAGAAAVPDGAISGKFSVSDSKQVYFSKGNLRYASSKWSFFDNQYDYYDSYSADAWDKFGWSTSASTYGMTTSFSSGDYSGDFVDWGATMGTGWFTLSKDEWTYLLDTRTVNGGTGDGKSYTKGQSVNGKLGVVIYPDNYTGAVYSGSDWATFESAGCVFLPTAGYRSGSSVNNLGTRGYYWSSSPNGTEEAYRVYFTSGDLDPADFDSRILGGSVRLVREVATSDEQEAVEGHALSAAAVGEIVGSDGKAYAAANKDNLPSGVTAVAMIWYVNGTHGLALALADEADDDNIMYNWETANTLCNAHTPAITGATWKLATQDDWNNMITGAGSAAALLDGFSSVVGENLQNSPYWSSTNYKWDGYAMHYGFNDFNWDYNGKENEDYVRACLSW